MKKVDWFNVVIHSGFFLLFAGVLFITIVFYTSIKLQGNHDTPVSQGNHDTTVQVDEELCNYAVGKVLGIKWEVEPNVKVHTISGASGETVANVIILYKDFPVVFDIAKEEEKYESTKFLGATEDGE